MGEPGQTLSDEEVGRLARELFAEIRGERQEIKAVRTLEGAAK